MTLKRKLADCTSALALVASLPYEKDLLSILPPEWAPKIALAAIIATLVLRLIPTADKPTNDPKP